MTEIRIPVPRLPKGLGANLVGLLGLLAFVLAIGGLTGNWWWSVLAGGLVSTCLAYIAQTHLAIEVEPAKPHLAMAKSA